jgi:hypothetical protein
MLSLTDNVPFLGMKASTLQNLNELNFESIMF